MHKYFNQGNNNDFLSSQAEILESKNFVYKKKEELTKLLQDKETSLGSKLLNKNEFIELYHSLSKREQLHIWDMRSYIERASKRNDVPKSYRDIIKLLEGDPTCLERDYLIALLHKKGPEYLLQKNKIYKTKPLDKNGIIKLYHNLPGDNQIKIFGDMKNYIERAMKRNDVPKSYRELIELLSGNPNCIDGEDVIALILAEGQYLQKRLQQNRKIDLNLPQIGENGQVSMQDNLSNFNNGFERRDYQIKAQEDMTTFTKKWIKNKLTNDKGIDLWTSMPVVMATGSGKTATVGKHLHKIFLTRDRLERRNNISYPLRVLVVTDRIDLVNQIKEDFIHGRDGKPPLLGEDIKSHATTKLHHSKADSIENIIVEDGVDIEGFGKDEIYFSTFRSAHKFAEEQKGRDIIIIDEAHHLSGATNRYILHENIAKSIQYKGKTPLIIPMSATMNKVNHILNDSVVSFGLAEYLASKYSPEVDYNLITSSDFSLENLEEIMVWIDEVANMIDVKEKRKKISEIKTYLEYNLAKFNDTRGLCQEVLQRLGDINHTIIFANSIEEVDKITAQFNELSGDKNLAIALHSKIKKSSSEVLNDYHDGYHKIIVARDMLNEGLDIPLTNHIIFWRNTESLTLFEQQLGRGLRGTKIKYRDYTGVVSNLSYINTINQQIDNIINISKKERVGGNFPIYKRKGIEVLFGEIGKGENSLAYNISLGDIIQNIGQLDEYYNNLPSIGEDGKVEIDGKIYQQFGRMTPKNQLRGFNNRFVKSKIDEKHKEWKNKYIKKAKSKDRGIIIDVCELEILEDLLKNKIGLPEVGEDGRIEIDDIVYRNIGQLQNINKDAIQRRIDNKNQKWKDKFIKIARLEGKLVFITICEETELYKLVKDIIEAPELGEDGHIEIDGKTYQGISSTTLSSQLWNLETQTVIKRIKKAEENSNWKSLYTKKAKSRKINTLITAYEINELHNLLKDLINLPKLEKNGQVKINGKEYQWVGSKTPRNQLRGASGITVAKKLKQQPQTWKDKFMKKAKPETGADSVNVYEINILKKFIETEKLNLPKLGKEGKIKIKNQTYQQVSQLTSSEQLWGFAASNVLYKIKKKGDQWINNVMKEAKTEVGIRVKVYEINALKELLGIKDDQQDIHKKLKDF